MKFVERGDPWATAPLAHQFLYRALAYSQHNAATAGKVRQNTEEIVTETRKAGGRAIVDTATDGLR